MGQVSTMRSQDEKYSHNDENNDNEGVYNTRSARENGRKIYDQ